MATEIEYERPRPVRDPSNYAPTGIVQNARQGTARARRASIVVPLWVIAALLLITFLDALWRDGVAIQATKAACSFGTVQECSAAKAASVSRGLHPGGKVWY